ncbi:hypothetical protein [Psychromonas aquatilis]|uniref:SGNH hydrolase-type esterase domain-containing protein n=1 Tax=Psychromonas aquatilis TaxID=2005072 RepID=A0ABU9GTX1_9GAMM
MKVCLLGGSNSVNKFGFRDGLCVNDDLKLAVGATGSLQNIHALHLHEKDIMSCDLIVSESNGNDTYNINAIKYPKQLIKDNIKELYYELYRTGKEVLILLTPMVRYSNGAESYDLRNEIEDAHMEQINKYGFYYINLEETITKKLDPKDPKTRFIMTDDRHPNVAFMHALGVNIRNYFSNNFREYTYSEGSNFYVTSPRGDNSIIKKENSYFSRELIELKSEVSVNVNDGVVVGIETWPDEVAQIKIKHNNGNVVKSFNQYLAFNEIIHPDLSRFTMESNLGEALLSTEPSINVRETGIVNKSVLYSSMLIRKNVNFHREITPRRVPENLDFLIPDLKPFFASFLHFLNHNSNNSNNSNNNNNSNIVDYLRDEAIRLENKDMNLAYEFMKRARDLRPTGPVIKKKLAEFKKILSKQNKDI